MFCGPGLHQRCAEVKRSLGTAHTATTPQGLHFKCTGLSQPVNLSHGFFPLKERTVGHHGGHPSPSPEFTSFPLIPSSITHKQMKSENTKQKFPEASYLFGDFKSSLCHPGCKALSGVSACVSHPPNVIHTDSWCLCLKCNLMASEHKGCETKGALGCGARHTRKQCAEGAERLRCQMSLGLGICAPRGGL